MLFRSPAFGSANAGLVKKDNVSLSRAEDVAEIVRLIELQKPAQEVRLDGAPVDFDETPTVATEASTALGEALRGCLGSLRRLKLVGHRFEDADAVTNVLQAMAGSTVLEELDLTNSNLKVEGGLALAAVLRGFTALRVLRLEDCEVEDEGCAAIAEALGQSASLEELDLRNNDMEADAAQVLARALPGMKALRALKLEDIEEALDPIIEALSGMGKEEVLKLDDDDDDEDEDEDGGGGGGEIGRASCRERV